MSESTEGAGLALGGGAFGSIRNRIPPNRPSSRHRSIGSISCGPHSGPDYCATPER
jgi:hypothetical protein